MGRTKGREEYGIFYFNEKSKEIRKFGLENALGDKERKYIQHQIKKVKGLGYGILQTTYPTAKDAKKHAQKMREFQKKEGVIDQWTPLNTKVRVYKVHIPDWGTLRD